MKWLVLLALADLLIVLVFIAPELLSGATLTQAGLGRILTATVMPVVILLIVNVLPSDVKTALVYWKPRGEMPGCEAFTKYGPADPRIDMIALKKNVGTLPTGRSEQNAKWYKLYKLVQMEPAVTESHKLFLMYRDMAALSLPLIVMGPLSLHLVGANGPVPWLVSGLFLAQYLLSALSARWSGIRLVCNVMAVHSARRVE